MNTLAERVIRRLQDTTANRGHRDGTKWAKEVATKEQLGRLATAFPNEVSTETLNAPGAPAVFLMSIEGEDYVADHQSVFDFWMDLGKERDDKDLFAPEYWDEFIVGALEEHERRESNLETLMAERSETESRGNADGAKWVCGADKVLITDVFYAWHTWCADESTGVMLTGQGAAFCRSVEQDKLLGPRTTLDTLWKQLGKSPRDTDRYSSDYWDGFAIAIHTAYQSISGMDRAIELSSVTLPVS